MRFFDKAVVLFVAFVVCFVFIKPQVDAKEYVLKAGTPIPVRLEEEADSETATAGETLRFRVIRNVRVEDVVVIEAGAEAVSEVTFAQKKGSLGKEGKVYLMMRYATAVDGTRVPLASKLSDTGDEKVARSWMICPFIKGTSARVPAGTETKAYVDYDTAIEIENSQEEPPEKPQEERQQGIQ